MKLKTEVQSTPDVPKDPLDQIEVWLPWSMHVQACLLYSMCNVWARQSQVLKSASEAAVLSGIGDEGTIISGELATSVYGSSTRVAVKHASSVKKVDCVLPLRQQHP
jgi:hypothetical protein